MGVTNLISEAGPTSARVAALMTAFAIQQFLETADSIFTPLFSLDANPGQARYKKALMKSLAIALAMVAAVVLKDAIDVVQDGFLPEWSRRLVTSLAIGGGAEALNSALKYVSYAKEAKKTAAAVALNATPTPDLRTIGRK